MHQTAANAPRPVADVLLRDGSIASIREVTPEDEGRLVTLHERVGPENTKLRFFSLSRTAGMDYVRHVVSSPATVALLAIRHGRVVALGTAEPVEPGVGEIAFLVADECHGLGIGSLLLEHLAAAARSRGMRRFVASVMADNYLMLGVLRDAGFAYERQTAWGTVEVQMDTAMSDAAQRAADERECRAERLSLAPVLAPRSVAVVGARRDGTGVGAAVLRSIVDGEFAGSVHVVHPQASSVQGVAAVRSLVDLAGGVDLVLVAVPATGVLDAVRDAVQAGCRGAVVLSSGFAEMGAEGSELQDRLLRIARDGNLRVIGPNCLGILNTDPAIRLNATFSGAVPEPGGLALASQSGGVGIVLGELARRLGIGVRQLISLGNKIDVSGNDLLAAWRDDPTVTAAGLYLESFGNAPKFARLAREFSERKPLLAVVGGRTSSGRRAGLSHTAAAASPLAGIRALFAQTGVIGCDTAEEMAECALLLQSEPLPRGRRVAILSNAGGMGVLAADAAEELGLEVPALSAALREKVGADVLGTAGVSNPVDAGAGSSPAAFGRLVDTLLGSDEIDALVVVLVATGASDAAAVIRSAGRARSRHPHKPALVVPFGDLPPAPGNVTTYRSTVAALRALGRAGLYEQWRREPHRADPPLEPDRPLRARQIAIDLLDDQTSRWLDASSAGVLLEEYELTPVGERVAGPDAAVAAAESLGFPVVVKSGDPEVVHRTDRGLVRTGLLQATAVRDAVADIEAVLGDATPLVVQPMMSGVEMSLGLVRDPQFGPLVQVGAGGVATEVWDDRVFLLPPVSRRDAARAIRSLRIWPLLQGYRGAPGGDVAGLEDLLVQVSQLADEVPAVAEMDLNPVMVGPSGCALVDVKIRLDSRPQVDAGVPRRL